jgi:hypothetical protein
MGAGHAVYLEQPAMFNTILSDFIARPEGIRHALREIAGGL